MKKLKKKPVSDFKILLEKFLLKKEETLEDLVELKLELIKKIDYRILDLHLKKNSLIDFLKNKKYFRKYKISVWYKFRHTSFKQNFKYIISAPFIYMMWIPAIFMHIFLEIYHQICFRLYNIPLVNPRDYFIFDRTHLTYLNWFEKFNCFFCSYFNCLVAYLREIAGRTERYWCPLKHTNSNLNKYHLQYNKFIDYSDAENFRSKWKELRRFEEYNKNE